MIDYGVDQAAATRMGLPLRGRLELLVEQLDSAAPLRRLLDRVCAGELVARRVCIGTGEVSLHGVSPCHRDVYLQGRYPDEGVWLALAAVVDR